jgi:hypothetical protein
VGIAVGGCFWGTSLVAIGTQANQIVDFPKCVWWLPEERFYLEVVQMGFVLERKVLWRVWSE